MFKLFRNILLFFMVLLSCFSAAAQLAMPDIVCIGATKHYGVNANSLSGSTYTWNINGVAQLSTINEIDITWNTEGTYLLTVQELSKDGCLGPLMSGQVFVGANPTINANVTMQPNCSVSTGSIELSGLPVGNWTINPGAITGATSSITLSGLSAGTYAYTVTNAAGCISAASVDIVINAATGSPSVPILDTITQSNCTDATGSVVLSGLPAGNWTINPGAITGSGASAIIFGLTAGTTYNYTVTNAAGCTSDPLMISIIEPDCDFNIPKGFSPNDDGINDKFVIRGIHRYPNNNIAIYNRWGNKVFEASPYQNTWDGTSDFGLLIGGDQLPDGTYFCILDLGDGSKLYKSYVYIKK